MDSRQNSFFAFLNKKGGVWIIVLVLALGLLLMLGFSGEGGENSEEERLAELCSSLEGVGKCRVMISYKGSTRSEPIGVVIACRGGDRLEVRHRLVELVGALYGIGTNRIAVEKLE